MLLLAAALGVAGCKNNDDNAAAPTSNDIVGHWKLVSRQCYCPRGPVPDETVGFTATQFSFYKAGVLSSSGSYSYGSVTSFCSGGTGSAPGLRFTYANGTQGPQSAIFTVTGNTLVLDYGGPCDAPVDTYERLP
ncbi:MAG: hypothetical protein JWR44_1568 [Hymenobacter sp.]|nr:hypothetical protein [Hymenobacter sp.]